MTLKYPEVPDILGGVPTDLEAEFQAAMAARQTAEEHLHSLAAVVDPSAEQVRAQLLAQIALDCAKIASSLAVCSIADWLDEAQEPPAYRWRAASPGRRRQNRRRPRQPGEVED